MHFKKKKQRCACHRAMRRDFLYVVIKLGKGEIETVSSEIRFFIKKKGDFQYN